MFYLIISYSVFSWSLNTVKEIRRAFPAPVFIGVSRDIQTDRSFPCAHSCYNPTSSAPSAFGLTGLSLSSQALPPGRAPQSALPRAPTAGRRQGRQLSLVTRLVQLMLLCRSLCGWVQVNYCKAHASFVWQAKDCNINTSFWKLFVWANE